MVRVDLGRDAKKSVSCNVRLRNPRSQEPVPSDGLSLKFTVDDDLRLMSWNTEFKKMTGKYNKKMKGSLYYETIPLINNGEVDAIREVLNTGKPSKLKMNRRICFHSDMMSDVEIAPRIDRRGKVCGAHVRIVADHRCDIINRYRESQKLAYIGKIAATLAHGVRNPLNAIKGAVMYLGEKYSGETAFKEFSGIINEEIVSLDSFISRFLSTAMSGEKEASADLNEIIRRLVAITSLQMQSYNVKHACRYGNIPLVNIDSFALEQAILNVMNNAIEAMPSGGRLKIKTKLIRSRENDFVMVEISDTGSGIEEGCIGGGWPQRAKKGKGFGLFITREVVQACRGRVELSSGKGGGTKIKIYLPTSREGGT